MVSMRSLPSQPFVVCRQCPGYRKEGAQDPFTTGSSVSVYPRSATLLGPGPLPPLGAAAATAGAAGPEPKEEGGGKPAAEQPSTSADGPAGTSLWGKRLLGTKTCLAVFKAA